MLVMLVVIVVIGVIVAGLMMSDVGKPDYQVLSKAKNIEIRQYPPMLIAKVSVSGERGLAIKEGFRLLADYIFGNNRINKKMAMTAPVQQQESAKIAMTAPVQQQSDGDSWQVSFIMPREYNIDTIPKPVNDKVQLEEIPAKQFIAIRFSGLSSQENIDEHEKALLTYINTNTIAVTGLPSYAFYNPPWTLPPMRRNEVLLQLKQPFQKNDRGEN